MNENSGAARPSVPKSAYEVAREELLGSIDRAPSLAEAHQRVCDELYVAFEHYSWVGIYSVAGDELLLSAWSGPEETEHTRIGIGEGICGLAAATGETELVPDVGERPEFIACFPSTKSEIVVPIHGSEGVIGEIDIDSDWLDAFGDLDREFLETIAVALGDKSSGKPEP
jgi:L-methionine (R)-S-oxide reductase